MSDVTPISLGNFPVNTRPWNNITPFTHRDGATYMQILESLRKWLRTELVPHINKEMSEISDAWKDAVTNLVASVEAAIAENQAEFDSKIAEHDENIAAALLAQDQARAAALLAHTEQINAALAQNLVDVESTVSDSLSGLTSQFTALSEQVAAWQESAQANNDPITANLVEGPSQTRTKIDAIVDESVSVLEQQTQTALQNKANVEHTHRAEDVTGTSPFNAALIPQATQTAVGGAEIATATEVNAGADNTRIVTPSTLMGFERSLRPIRNRMVVVGSSNAVGGADYWPQKLANQLGLTLHAYAIAGSAYTNANNFDTQVQNAIAGMSATQRAEVSHFFVADASNNSRAKTPYSDVFNNAVTTYQRIRDWFVNAKIVVIPQIWPSDTSKYAPTQFPYDQEWNAYALMHAEAQRLALEWHSNATFVDESWTWLTGRDAYMTANNDVHPNSGGHTIIARMLARFLAGEDVTPNTQWNAAAALTGAVLGGRGRNLSARRDGWDVILDGSVRWTKSGGGAVSEDIATVPYGFRPTYNVQAMGTQLGIVTSGPNIQVPVEIWPNGAVRLYRAIPQNDGVWLNVAYRLG